MAFALAARIERVLQRCEARGVGVVRVAGWEGRGHGNLTAVSSITIHHTAGPNNGEDYPSLRTVRDGRPGLPGPLAQFGVGRSGRIFAVAAGLSWHAGRTHHAWQNNWHALGVEVENDGRGEPYSVEVMTATRILSEELAAEFGVPVERVVGHKEIAAPAGRKIDPSFDMGAFRASLGAGGDAGAPVATPAPAPAPAPRPAPVSWPAGYALPRGHYYGHKAGPAASHGGYHVAERNAVKSIQRALIAAGCVPGVSDPNSRWADGLWEDATSAACRAWFARYRPGQPFTDRIYADDLHVLLRTPVPAPAPAPAPVPAPPAPVGAPTWPLGPGKYFGHKNGPAASIGGYHASERPLVAAVQRAFQAAGCAPGHAGWADGLWEDATSHACRAWFARYRPGQQYTDRIYSDDWAQLMRGRTM